MDQTQTQTRQSIDNGGWINLDTAVWFEEATYFDGNNHISENTRSQWEHERLHRSVGGVYVIQLWSQYYPSSTSWTRINLDRAVAWLVRNGYELADGAEADSAAAAEV